jgi:hypothetical protein
MSRCRCPAIVDDDALAQVREIPGVAHAVTAHRAEAVEDFKGERPEIYVIDPDTASTVLGDSAADLVPGRVVVPEDYSDATVRIKGLNEMNVPVHKEGLSSLAFFTTPEVGNSIGVSATSTSVLVRLDEDVDVDEIDRIQQSVAEALDVSSDEVGGSAVARGAYSELIDVMLAGAVGLLFVSVLIALIGVSNTVSLSVIERRRENALMRALGLSIAQLRTLLALEAVLISSVAALVGLDPRHRAGDRRHPTAHPRLLHRSHRRRLRASIPRHPRRRDRGRHPLRSGAGSSGRAPVTGRRAQARLLIRTAAISRSRSPRPDPARRRAGARLIGKRP